MAANGDSSVQVMRHAPCVVMLVHDCANDRYLIEREYRVGCDAFAYGLPAGLIDGGEDAEQAALRELREETGVEPTGHDGIEFDHVGRSTVRRHDRRARQHHGASPAFMAPRRTSLRRRRACRIGVGFLAAAARRVRITASNSMIAILHEQIGETGKIQSKVLSNRKNNRRTTRNCDLRSETRILESCKSDPDRCIRSAQAMTAPA